jgi:hypothetical protein
MLKIDPGLLQCKNPDCHIIPTIVLECEYPSGKRRSRSIYCTDCREVFFERACFLFGRQNLKEYNYPAWLQKLHMNVLNEGKIEGRLVKPEDIERLREFVDHHRNPQERR